MSDRTCPECGTPLVGSWTTIGGHQTGSSACAIAKTLRDMTAIDYTHVDGRIAVALKAHGVAVKYGKVANPDLGLSAFRRASIGSWVPKAHWYVYVAVSEALRLRAIFDRLATDPDFTSAIIAIGDLAGDQLAARKAVREYIAAEKLL